MLIPMAGAIVSRLSSNSFEKLWRPEMREHLRCEALLLQKVRNIPSVAFVLPKTMLIKGSQYNDCSSFVDHLFIPWAYWGSNTIHRPRFIVIVTLENLDRA